MIIKKNLLKRMQLKVNEIELLNNYNNDIQRNTFDYLVDVNIENNNLIKDLVDKNVNNNKDINYYKELLGNQNDKNDVLIKNITQINAEIISNNKITNQKFEYLSQYKFEELNMNYFKNIKKEIFEDVNRNKKKILDLEYNFSYIDNGLSLVKNTIEEIKNLNQNQSNKTTFYDINEVIKESDIIKKKILKKK